MHVLADFREGLSTSLRVKTSAIGLINLVRII